MIFFFFFENISSLLVVGSCDGQLDRLIPLMSASLTPRKRTTSQCKSEPPLLRTSKRTIYTAGRPPWYNEHGTQSKEAFVIGEKTSLIQKLLCCGVTFFTVMNITQFSCQMHQLL